ncbi:MAG TPA: undecaprenyl-diphosphatase UppP [Terriglobia bacterium]|nr:undecaprenyl-diphosphatase UppP [Terriglobia bacterium]
MPLYQVIVLGVVQGLTEFLPISSTAHLYLVPWLSGWAEHELTFDVALHLGTLVAVLVYFLPTWVELLRAGLGIRSRFAPAPQAQSGGSDPNRNRRLFWLLVIGTIPAGVAGILFEEHVKTTLRSPVVMGVALIVVALVMALGERVGTYGKDLFHVGITDTLTVGVGQALALIPGVSRSGITMTAGLLRGLRRDAAARFSFLLSTPIIAGAAVVAAVELHREGMEPGMGMPFAVGILVSAITGYLTISFFLKFLQFGTFKIFIYYRIILGIIVLALAFFPGPGAP